MIRPDIVIEKSLLDTYSRDGFLRVGSVFPGSESARWAMECDRLWTEVDDEDSRVHWRDHKDLGRIADRLDPVVDISPVFEALASDQRLLDLVRMAFDGDGVLFKAKLIMKMPGTRGYDLHQDYPYWEFLNIPADEMIIVVIPIDPWDSESGAIEFFPGYHDSRIPGPPQSPLDTDPAFVDLASGSVMELSPGDVCLFHPLTPHRSSPNSSDHARRSLYFTYVRGAYHDVYEQYYSARPDYEDHKRTPGK